MGLDCIDYFDQCECNGTISILLGCQCSVSIDNFILSGPTPHGLIFLCTVPFNIFSAEVCLFFTVDQLQIDHVKPLDARDMCFIAYFPHQAM